VKSDARIDHIYLGIWPPFHAEPRQRIAATAFRQAHDSQEGHLTTVRGLGYTDGLLVQPFTTPSYQPSEAPYVEYMIDIQQGDSELEIRTLPTLHVYEGRDARYAVQLGDAEPQIFSIHANDFTAEWRFLSARSRYRAAGGLSVWSPVICPNHAFKRVFIDIIII